MSSVQKSARGEWPRSQIVKFRKALLRWYHEKKRPLPWRGISDPYKIWVSEVMLQQTQVATVLNYYPKFVKKYPTVRQLARASGQEVLKAWEKMGYYARARNLHKAADIVVEQHDGEVPGDYKTFRRLPGVGDYIASAVQSIAFAAPHAVVDGNVKRLLSRLFLLPFPANDSRYHPEFKEIAQNLIAREEPGAFNQAMMELGAVVCRPQKPLCGNCPVAAFCAADREKRQSEFPKKKVRPKIPTHNVAIGIIFHEGKLLITRRPEDGLLGGLWEFPGGKIKTGETARQACRREILEEVNLEIEVLDSLAQVKHTYSHFKIKMEVFCCRWLGGRIRLSGPVEARWISPNELDAFPFPGANLKFFPALKQYIKSNQ